MGLCRFRNYKSVGENDVRNGVQTKRETRKPVTYWSTTWHRRCHVYTQFDTWPENQPRGLLEIVHPCLTDRDTCRPIRP